MLDIEDAPLSSSNSKRVEAGVRVTKMARQRMADGDALRQSFVPGTQSVWVKTFGCSHNASDSEYMSGLLHKAGYHLESRKENAALWLVNSCTVKTPSETQAFNLIDEARSLDKAIVFAGCVSQAAPDDPALKGVSIVGVKQIDRVVEVVEETLKGNSVRLLSRSRPDASLDIPKIRKNALIEVLAINTGCLNHCTYCKTKLARGDLKSYPLVDLMAQAKRSFDEGVKELWLTSEDLGAWGRDLGMVDFFFSPSSEKVLVDLLEALLPIVPADCMVRLGMTNPPYILDFLPEIAKILRHPRVYSFLHIPVQSGSDSVLRDMRREYTVAHFATVVDYMTEQVPDVYIATDMICAFPTETEEDFRESMKLVAKYKFPSLFINQFYPRSGTPAARLKAKRRTAEMSSLFRSYTRYTHDRVGEVHRVLICEKATDGRHLVGHNKSYEHFLVADNGRLMGTWADVRVVECSKFYMKAELVDSRKWKTTTVLVCLLPVLILVLLRLFRLL